MDAIAESSSNTLAGGGGQVASADIPKDGTGMEMLLHLESPGYQLTYMRIGVVTLDPWLSPFKDSLKRRYSKAQDWIKTIQDTEGGLDKFSKVWLMGWDNVRSHGADSHIRGPTPWDCT